MSAGEELAKCVFDKVVPYLGKKWEYDMRDELIELVARFDREAPAAPQAAEPWGYFVPRWDVHLERMFFRLEDAEEYLRKVHCTCCFDTIVPLYRAPPAGCAEGGEEVAELRKLLNHVDGEFSAMAHGRPMTDHDEMLRLSGLARKHAAQLDARRQAKKRKKT